MTKPKESMSIGQLLSVIEDVLAQGGEFLLHPGGVSMLPTLKEGRDTVTLSPVSAPLKRGDILLYRREGGGFVLHRVVKVAADGSLWMRGDNQYTTEKGVLPTQIIAIVKRYERAGKTVFVDALSSRLYRARRTLTYPIRRVARGLRRRVRVLFGGDRHA